MDGAKKQKQMITVGAPNHFSRREKMMSDLGVGWTLRAEEKNE